MKIAITLIESAIIITAFAIVPIISCRKGYKSSRKSVAQFIPSTGAPLWYDGQVQARAIQRHPAPQKRKDVLYETLALTFEG